MRAKAAFFLLCIAIFFLFVGCESNHIDQKTSFSSNNDVSTILKNAESETPQSTETMVEDKEKNTEASQPSNDAVDIDLTALSDTMVYSEVYNIVVSPDTYRGKTIKIQGLFNSYGDDKTGKQYFYCLIPDATACCTKGIEFQLSGSNTYPDDYPKEGSQITIVGTFDTYEYNDFQFSYLREAKLV